jgi:hypothetical protein
MSMSSQRLSQCRFGRRSGSRRQRLRWQGGYIDMPQGCAVCADQDTRLSVAVAGWAAQPGDWVDIVHVEQGDPDTPFFHYLPL